MSKLYIVATPIGNLDDITKRALDTLSSVDFILCEDTRTTQKLLNHFDIKTKTISYHQHSTEKKIKEIQELLDCGNNLALVTDAGTPGISDPGNYLIQELNNIEVIPIPGPSAITTALSISGFATDKFIFLGFPPQKNKRQKYFKELLSYPYTVVFYESCHRILKTLNEIKELDDSCMIVVCRELTKKFETIYRGNIKDVINSIDNTKGEFTIVLHR